MLAPDGDDLRKLPLSLRKQHLSRLLKRRPNGIFLDPFEQGEIGPDLFRAACSRGLEGLVSERANRPYRAGCRFRFQSESTYGQNEASGFSKGGKMKRFLATAAIALSMTTAAQAANTTAANTAIIFARDYWRVVHMARNDDGKPMCIMHSQLSFAGSVAFVQIKWVKGTSNPFIQLSKTNWHFPPDMQVPFSVELDNGHRKVVGVSKTSFQKSIVFTYLIDDGNSFLDDLASSEAMTINFHNGNEPAMVYQAAFCRNESPPPAMVF